MEVGDLEAYRPSRSSEKGRSRKRRHSIRSIGGMTDRRTVTLLLLPKSHFSQGGKVANRLAQRSYKSLFGRMSNDIPRRWLNGSLDCL
jgi:hypothetical protein